MPGAHVKKREIFIKYWTRDVFLLLYVSYTHVFLWIFFGIFYYMIEFGRNL